MKRAHLVLLLALYYLSLFGFASARKCLTLPTGENCCGLAVATFSVGITENFAQVNRYFEDEGINVCFYRLSSSVLMYDTLLANGTVDLYVLNDYGVHDYNFIPYGNNRLQVVQAGYLTVNGVNVTIAATMQNNIAPYLFSYPVVNLAQQAEHFCPSQGTGYVAPTPWLANQDNQADLFKFFRALLRSYLWVSHPSNKEAVTAWISSSTGTTDPGLIELVYDDYFINPATGLNPYLTPRKAGMRNILNARIAYGMSPIPAEGVEGLLKDKAGGFVDLSALRAAQASLEIVNNYDTDDGLAGCPVYNKGTIVPGPPQFTCAASYSISSQPPSWPNGMTAQISVTVSNISALTVNGAPGWSLTFSAKGAGIIPAFQITSSWNTGTVSSTTSGLTTNYVITNAAYNAQSPQSIGWNAATTRPAPGNNICNIRLNGIPCSVSTPSTASVSC